MLDLSATAGELTRALVDVPSVSGAEAEIADLVQGALARYPLAVQRIGNVVIARTDLGQQHRVVLAGHLDTVPIAGNVPAQVDGDRLTGCGAVDMKSGLAVLLRLAHLVGTGALEPTADLTWLLYDCEEIEASRNGLNRLASESPELLAGDLAILAEPTDGVIEGGCQGTLRAEIVATGERAHSARSWLGVNAIHGIGPALASLAAYQAAEVDVDGLTYREGLNAVFISGGVAGNVIPDECRLTVNYRFAPDKSEQQAFAHVRQVFAGFEVTLQDSAPGARPGLHIPVAQAMVAATGGRATAKLGWTDVARFSALGIPAVNFGPGDPNLAHTKGEWVSLSAIERCELSLRQFLGGPLVTLAP